MGVKNYKDLVAYQESYTLCLEIYKLTDEFPKSEIYGLTSQIRRSAVSIPSNIAEGYRRMGANDYRYFLKIAMGSCAEHETQLTLSIDLKYADENIGKSLLQKIDRITGLLFGLLKSIPPK